MVQSIQLDASETDQQALLNAINSASKQNVPLLLKPGTHLTRPGRVNQIPIGGNGLAIGPLSRHRLSPRRSSAPITRSTLAILTTTTGCSSCPRSLT